MSKRATAAPTATPTRRRRQTRGWSREFTPPTGEGHAFNIRRIPAALWIRVQAKARRDGVSLRNTVLKYLREWSDA